MISYPFQVSEEASKVPAITEDASIEVKEEQEEEELIDESELYGYEDDPEIKEEEDGNADGQQEMDESDIKEEKEEVVEVKEEEEEEEHSKKGNEVQKPKRQTFVFSATLTITRKGREKVNPKDNKKGRKINANAISNCSLSPLSPLSLCSNAHGTDCSICIIHVQVR